MDDDGVLRGRSELQEISPGYLFKAPNKLWLSRSRVSEGSLVLANKRLLFGEGIPQQGGCQHKITRVAFEELLERANLVWAKTFNPETGETMKSDKGNN